jgi:spermidine/putrescine transport system ATP-binding protein
MTRRLEIRGLTKEFDSLTAVDGLSLTIEDGEFFTLVGPSGCGKTTTLRCIAGLEPDTEGEIRIGGDEITEVPVHERNIGMVFQNYALFPHLNVRENVAFGLKMEGKTDGLDERVTETLKLVQLEKKGESPVDELSGGQQQRVALARSLAIEPAILLSDEPLGALDLKLRQELQVELKDLQDALGITMLHVTHDQQEALTMSDRIGVMRDGKLVQVGTPEELYENPRNTFISNFLGRSNVLACDVVERTEGRVELRLADQEFGVVDRFGSEQAGNGTQEISIRPEKIGLAREDELDGTEVTYEGQITDVIYLGSITLYEVDSNWRYDGGTTDSHNGRILIQTQGRHSVETGDVVDFGWDTDAVRLLEG